MPALAIAFLATVAIGYGLGRLMPAGGFFAVLGLALLLFVALGTSVAVVSLLVQISGIDVNEGMKEAFAQFPVVWIGGIIAFLNARRAAARAAAAKAAGEGDKA
jgi:hypothetical protein